MARAAYALGLHKRDRPGGPASGPGGQKPAVGTDADEVEAANTWWGIVIYERVILCDATVQEHPLLSVLPNNDAHLPTDPEYMDRDGPVDVRSSAALVSSFITLEVGRYAHAAQAACLLDRAIKATSGLVCWIPRTVLSKSTPKARLFRLS